MVKTLIAVALLGTMAAANAELGIKDFLLGEELSAAAAKGGMGCSTSKDVPGPFCSNINDRKPDLITTIAGVPAKRVIISGLDDGKLGNIRYSFSQAGFGIVRGAFVGKYPDMKCEDSTVKNRMGAEFDQTVCTYTSPDGTLTIRRRGSDLTEGDAVATSAAYIAGSRAWLDKRKVEGKKDI